MCSFVDEAKLNPSVGSPSGGRGLVCERSWRTQPHPRREPVSALPSLLGQEVSLEVSTVPDVPCCPPARPPARLGAFGKPRGKSILILLGRLWQCPALIEENMFLARIFLVFGIFPLIKEVASFGMILSCLYVHVSLQTSLPVIVLVEYTFINLDFGTFYLNFILIFCFFWWRYWWRKPQPSFLGGVLVGRFVVLSELILEATAVREPHVPWGV